MIANSQYVALIQFRTVLMLFASKNRVPVSYDQEEDQCLQRREHFAVSLRKAKKAIILAGKRLRLQQNLKALEGATLSGLELNLF